MSSPSSLYELMQSLSRSSGPFAKLEGKAPALTTPVELNEDYVWPDLVDFTTNEEAHVLLVEAAGAVGKSEAARALASHLNWPLVNAAGMQVGDYSLTGQVFAAFGMESDFIPRLARGEVGLVIDALDEAHLKAGTSNFQAFLDNVAWFSNGNASSGLRIILFSRPDTAELVRAQFEDIHTPLATATIAFFSYDQACRFINLCMKIKHRENPDKNYDVAERSPIPFGQMRDAQIAAIASSLLNRVVQTPDDQWSDVREFLGYAPVLAVLAEFLAVSNPHASRHSDVTPNLSSHLILLQIIGEILDREQGKFQGSKSKELHAKLPADREWPLEQDAYSAVEQTVRLVARYLRLTPTFYLPASLPIEIRDEYEKAASQFTADHPFLAGREALNVVFGDYIKAKAAVDATCHSSLTPSPVSSVRDPGPFFAKFVHEFSGGRDGNGKVDERLIVPLLDSHLKGLQRVPTYLSFTLSQEDSLVLLSLEDEDIAYSLDFQVDDSSGVVHFPERVARGIVVCSDTVVLGVRNSGFFLGPAATVIGTEIVIEAGQLSVDSSAEYRSTLLARESVQANYLQQVNCYRADNLRVYGKSIPVKLHPYRLEFSKAGASQVGDYVHLRAIIRSFRQGAGQSPSVYSELLEQRIVKSHEIRLRLLRRLQELGFITKENDHYYLATKELSRYGMSWGAMVNGTGPAEEMDTFLRYLAGDEGAS